MMWRAIKDAPSCFANRAACSTALRETSEPSTATSIRLNPPFQAKKQDSSYEIRFSFLCQIKQLVNSHFWQLPKSDFSNCLVRDCQLFGNYTYIPTLVFIWWDDLETASDG